LRRSKEGRTGESGWIHPWSIKRRWKSLSDSTDQTTG
jgi:hypothetical protein